MTSLPYRLTEPVPFGEVRHQPKIEIDEVHRAEVQTLLDKYAHEAMERVEDDLFEIIGVLNQRGSDSPSRVIVLTGGLYLGLVKVIADIRTTLNAVGEFQMIRRREILDRLDALEARPMMKYLGVWKDFMTYETGSIVTFDGSMWHGNIQSRGVVPGDKSMTWTLCTKKGRDGRDRGPGGNAR